VHGSAQRCLRWPYRPWNRWLQNRRMRRQSDSNNFTMPPEAVQQLMIFYICPRPVVLVSVADRTHSNLFPMDLIGPVSADRFTLALRSTSPSIATMKSARQVAVSDVPASHCATAYKLGIHHKSALIDWHQLPFAVRKTRDFQLPYPAIALRVRELEILDCATIGSHTLFVTRVASEAAFAQDPQLFHASGIYQHFRARNARPFPMTAN
jgi:flavin reductase (DIM6/NTAB) family NADH-FMN oxidoreductase RutF